MSGYPFSPGRLRHPEVVQEIPRTDSFICKHCHTLVYTHPLIAGVQNRNHCPFCLWSRHVDHLQVGDRLSACKAIMQPLGLTLKRSRNKYAGRLGGELMLIHRCNDCGKISINRIAADDWVDRLMEIFHASFNLDVYINQRLRENGIHLLQISDFNLVNEQLNGIRLN